MSTRLKIYPDDGVEAATYLGAALLAVLAPESECDSWVEIGDACQLDSEVKRAVLQLADGLLECLMAFSDA